MRARRLSEFTPLLLLGVIALALAACGGSGGKPAPTTTTTPPVAGASDRWGTAWLCRPGLADNPCISDLAATAVTRTGSTHPVPVPSTAGRAPAVDCFYVYPTISDERTINADRAVGFRQREVATAQASRFSQVCRVFAPVYRQITLNALVHPARITLADALIAYRDVRGAFLDYLHHDNGGRGIVLLGHSQGAVILIRLLQQEFDRNAALRRRLVSALLIGGNVTVARGGTTGGDFVHIPACSSGTQTGCIVAYSSFTSKPPENSQFGRTTSDAGVDLLAPRRAEPGLQIMCVNPAAPAGGSGILAPYLPSLALAFVPAGKAPKVSTPWVTFPLEYRARCESSGDATWLQVTHIGGADRRPLLTRLQDPALGLHILDVNLALGNLVRLVGAQAAAFGRR
jgi:hypothetical protein